MDFDWMHLPDTDVVACIRVEDFDILTRSTVFPQELVRFSALSYMGQTAIRLP